MGSAFGSPGALYAVVLRPAAIGLLLLGLVACGAAALHSAETKSRADSAARSLGADAGATPSSDQPSPAPKAAPAGEQAAPTALQLLREGVELRDQLGTFRAVGGRLIFSLDKQPVRLVALENLNLERVSRVLAENPAAAGWRVSGVVSEYRGVNYVLIERAVLRSNVAEPPPPAIPATPSATPPTGDSTKPTSPR